MSNIIVLGGGMVGSAMAIDLAKQHDVTLTDMDSKRLIEVQDRCEDLKVNFLDVTSPHLEGAIKDFDLVVCAVPGFLGFNVLKRIIKAGKDVIDISFFPEDSLELHNLAIEYGVIAIVDCGVAPGMDNLILGYYNSKLELTDFECLVGGLPKTKKWPFNYKAPFSPIDVIEEYTRPARYVENGNIITRDALTDVELVEFDKVGTLESFNSDGLRSIIETMSHIPNMKEKTLRYVGHCEYVSVLKATGFFDTKMIDVGGVKISPLEFTSKLLFNEWKLGMEEEEFTVMRVTVKGVNDVGDIEEIVVDLYDEYNNDTNTSSMARVTGYTATAAANMFLDGLFTEKGVFPPELIGGDKVCYNYIMDYLSARGINYIIKGKTLK